ncbi:MAG: AhpA/YtjB family protein [Psychromonas sp.]
MNKKMYYLLRSTQIISLIVVCVVMAYHFMTLKNTGHAIKYQQTEKFSYSLTNLAASEASRFLARNKNEELQLLIDDLSNDPIVRDATIYDHLGVVIIQSKNVLSLPKLLNLDGSNSEHVQGIIPHIAELYEDDNKIGYIRISLEQNKILSLISDYQEKSYSTIMLIFILAFVAGTILMALMFRRVESIYLFLVRKLTRTKKPVIPTE